MKIRASAPWLVKTLAVVVALAGVIGVSAQERQQPRTVSDFFRDFTAEWMRANHAFHDVIYDASGAPFVAAQAKAARRTFAGGLTWMARGELDDLYARNDAQHRAIRNALAARSAPGAGALAREHVHSSYELLLAILDYVDRGGEDQGFGQCIARDGAVSVAGFRLATVRAAGERQT